MPTLPELKQLLVQRLDPNELLEVLDIPMEDLVEALSDYISDKYDYLVKEYCEEESEE